eukprot:CAMPEP_0116889776 /NCGR_PEP_ID=MMETSP0467-20121206/314_1 /TAXON_ID=283647 /ORGANISM="Mesodinium pulex, Strain SPMC105" /LENGTH=58 /DNA_ID=CAMNT_0004556873 /DNA_START=1659 /DNA_END=1832 /DNA_ORIENTATION=-
MVLRPKFTGIYKESFLGDIKSKFKHTFSNQAMKVKEFSVVKAHNGKPYALANESNGTW